MSVLQTMEDAVKYVVTLWDLTSAAAIQDTINYRGGIISTAMVGKTEEKVEI